MVSQKKMRSRDPWDWESPKPRNRPLPEPPKVGHRKKNTRRWCKGVVGREHVTATVLNHHPMWGECGWRTYRALWPSGKPISHRWVCNHVVECTVCGKHMKEFLDKEECPIWLETRSLPPAVVS